MTEQHDRDELVELMSRYANMPDTQNWDELPRSVFCDEFTCDFSDALVETADPPGGVGENFERAGIGRVGDAGLGQQVVGI